MSTIPEVMLSDGQKIPSIGFGCYKVENQNILDRAIALGYRLFDTASFYGNETLVGEAVRRSIHPRSEFFVTSKVWKTQMGAQKTRRALGDSLKKTGLESLDLYLIHWPRPDLSCDWQPILRDTWKEMEQAAETGKVRSIGVSNFFPHHLDVIMQDATIKPVVNQIEFHPGYRQPETVEFCQKHGIIVQAWSPLARGRLNDNQLLYELSLKYQKTLSQICIRFALQHNVLPIIKTNSENRLAENLQVFDFELEADDMEKLDSMPLAGWSGENPDYPNQ